MVELQQVGKHGSTHALTQRLTDSVTHPLFPVYIYIYKLLQSDLWIPEMEVTEALKRSLVGPNGGHFEEPGISFPSHL